MSQPLMEQLNWPLADVRAFCEKWQIAELALFGSVLRADFGPESDIDVLVSFHPEAKRTLFDLAQMEEELGTLFGRKVDILTRKGVAASPNYIRRKAILESAQVLYAE